MQLRKRTRLKIVFPNRPEAISAHHREHRSFRRPVLSCFLLRRPCAILALLRALVLDRFQLQRAFASLLSPWARARILRRSVRLLRWAYWTPRPAPLRARALPRRSRLQPLRRYPHRNRAARFPSPDSGIVCAWQCLIRIDWLGWDNDAGKQGTACTIRLTRQAAPFPYGWCPWGIPARRFHSRCTWSNRHGTA